MLRLLKGLAHMSDSFSKEQSRTFHPAFKGSAVAASADEWYDQGFDLADDSQSSQAWMGDDGFGVNPNLLDDAQAHFSEASKHRLRSDAEEQLQDGTLQINVDPLSPIREISAGAKSFSAHEGDIEVGGNGRIFDKNNAQQGHARSEYLGPLPKPANIQQVGTIYSPEYLAKKAKEKEEEALKEIEQNDEYRTVVRHRGNKLDPNDTRYLQALREQNAEREAQNFSNAFGSEVQEPAPKAEGVAYGGQGSSLLERRGNLQAASEYLGPKAKPADVKQVGTVYSPEFLLQKEREAAERERLLREQAANAVDQNDEYRTVVRRNRPDSAEDSNFANSLHEDHFSKEARNALAQEGSLLDAVTGGGAGVPAGVSGGSGSANALDVALPTPEQRTDFGGEGSLLERRAGMRAASDYLGPKAKPAEVKQVGTVYSPEFLSQKEREEAERERLLREQAANAVDQNDEYRTVVRRNRPDSAEDSNFASALHEDQLIKEARDALLPESSLLDAVAGAGVPAGVSGVSSGNGSFNALDAALPTFKEQTDFGGEGSLLSRRASLRAASDYLGPKPKPAEVKQVGTVYSPEFLAQKRQEALEHERLLRENDAENGDYRTVVRRDRPDSAEDSHFAAALHEDQLNKEARDAIFASDFSSDDAGGEYGVGVPRNLAAYDNLYGDGNDDFGSLAGAGADLSASLSAGLGKGLTDGIGGIAGTNAVDLLSPTAKGLIDFGGEGSLLTRRASMRAASDYLGPKAKPAEQKQVGTVYSPEFLAQKEREAREHALLLQERPEKFDEEYGEYRTKVRHDHPISNEDSHFSHEFHDQRLEKEAREHVNRGFNKDVEEMQAASLAARDAAILAAAKAAKGSTVYGGEGSLLARKAKREAASDYLGAKPRVEDKQTGSVYSQDFLSQRERDALNSAQQQLAQVDDADFDSDYRTRVNRPKNGMSDEDARFLLSLNQGQDTPNNASAPVSLSLTGGYSDKERDKMRKAQQSRLQQHQQAINKRASVERQQFINAQQERVKIMRQRQLQEQQARKQAAQKAAPAFVPKDNAKVKDGGLNPAVEELTGVAAAEARAAAQTMSYSEAIKDQYTTKGALELRKMREQELAQSLHPNKPKSNSEKTLEELAREYPGLSPEHLVKLKRSSNRCHLVSRTPIYDASSNISMYELKFTAGKVFQVNALKSDHVYHVLFGYFIRRGISCFIGRNKSVFVMMPITYDFLDYIDRYSVNRVVLRICPEQPVTPSALHILTKLRRAGMSFAIDLMVLLKRDWNKAVLSIEYVMIDMSDKVREQLSVFQRLKIKAPWLKSVGFNDINGHGYSYLAKHMIDFLDAPFWSMDLNFVKDISPVYHLSHEVVLMIHELFKDLPNYNIFQIFLRGHEALSRDMAVFLYRFRHASPRQVQNISELFNFLLDYNSNRSFSIMAGRIIMSAYAAAADMSSQSILQERYSQAIIRGYFVEYISKIFNDPFVNRFAFQCGMFSLLHFFLLKEEVDVMADDQYADVYDRIYGESELMADIIECVQAIESTDLSAIFEFIHKYRVPPASVLISYEKALMRTNELLLVMNIIPNTPTA